MSQRIPFPLVRASSTGRRRSGDLRTSADRRRAQHPAELNDLAAQQTVANDDPRIAVDRALDDILESVVAVTGAENAFLMLSRDHRSVEIVATHKIRPGEILHAAVTRIAAVMNRAFSQRQMTLSDGRGRSVPLPGPNAHCSPVWVCAPVCAGMKISGLLCMERRVGGKRLTELDLEIVQALADQAATALAAVRTHDALSRLSAVLSGGTPVPSIQLSS